MNDSLLFAYELYRARRDDWLRWAREHRGEQRSPQPLRLQREAPAPDALAGGTHRD